MSNRNRFLAFVSLLMLFYLILGLGQGVDAAEYALGDIPLDQHTYQQHLKVWPKEAAEALPSHYDARVDDIVTPAKDQGSCGSCWAFASVGAFESHLLKEFGLGPTDLSEQQLVSCNLSMSGCCGGSSTASRYWEDEGPIYEICFPYAESGTSCPTQRTVPCSNGSGCSQLTYRVTNWHTVGASDFKTSLYNDGPSYWRFDVYDDFFSFWNTGSPGEVYVQSSGGYAGGHAVLVIGWDDAKAAYLCKNSWGATDGPNGDGTFWIAYSGHAHSLNFQMANFDLVVLADVSLSLIPDTDVIPRGGTLRIHVTVTNDTQEVQTVYFFTNVTLPNGSIFPPFGYLFGPYMVSLDPYESESGPLSHPIPGGAPLGRYTYHGYVGTPGLGIIDEAQFDFDVIEE